jgi:hypothetical protein
MYTAADGLVWHQVFQFPDGLHESVIWRKYKPANDDVHDLGRERERQKRLAGKSLGYAGFICAFSGEVRSIKTQRGHSFRLDHMPEEGIYHAGIQYAPANDGPLSSLLKNDKSELKLMLKNAFGVLVRKRGDKARLPARALTVLGRPGARSFGPTLWSTLMTTRRTAGIAV